jgi:8-oxo-dGTP diphosphatase
VPEPQVVVAAALLRRGEAGPAVLAAERSHPDALAGKWELPGGKVEPDEPEIVALKRECREELGVDVAVGERVGPDLPIAPGRVLRVFRAELVSGEPYPHEHASLRWLTAGELEDVPWLPADRPLLPELRQLLQSGDLPDSAQLGPPP